MDRDQQRMDAAARLVLERMPLMTDAKRLAALETVVEAALKWWGKGKKWQTWADVDDLSRACATLDALPSAPAPAGETVTLAVWGTAAGDIKYTRPGSPIERSLLGAWTRLGTVTLPLDVEPTP